jgi:CopA family copper-resistance protein
MTTRYPRRQFLQATAALGASLKWMTPAYGQQSLAGGLTPESGNTRTLEIARRKVDIAGGRASATLVNGTIPGPLLRFREGESVTLRVTNTMDETTSIHWHGLLVPFEMDGVPGVSFSGIAPRSTFTYQFKLRQSGTYWYHSHSGMQEQTGVYGPLIIDPTAPDPAPFDREHVVLLSDWTFEDPMRVMARMKKQANYYNFQQRTVGDFFRDVSRDGLGATLSDRFMWGRMRMDPADILDVTGATYTFLTNGLSPALNWTGLFKPGERVRLRFINAAAMTIFDVRLPGLKLTVVQADGQDVNPVVVDEFRIAPAETYDVIVQPGEREAYTIFAESMDRSGYAAGTLAQRLGARAEIPPRRKRPLRTMADMGMAGHGDMKGMKHGAGMHGRSGPAAPADPHAGHRAASTPKADEHAHHGEHGASGKGDPHAGHAPAEATKDDAHAGHTPAEPAKDDAHAGHAPAPTRSAQAAPARPARKWRHGPDTHGPGNAMIAEEATERLDDPGVGFEGSDRRVLVYRDLRRVQRDEDTRPPAREIELHITGNMERQIWGIDGKKYSEAPQPIPFQFGERIRVTFVNDTMMDHPMHLHGMWMVLENGAGDHLPYKHTILVKGGERLSFLSTPDERGLFAFHCHLLYHMEMGMFRVVEVLTGKSKRSA